MRDFFKEKGQGLTGFVLVLAFVASIAYTMINGESGLKSTVNNGGRSLESTVNITFSKSNSKLSNAATGTSQ